MAGQSIGDLFIKVGYELDDTSLKALESSVNDVFKGLMRSAGIAGGAVGFGAMLNDAANTATQIRNLNTELGLNKQKVAEWAAAWQESNPLSSFSEGLQVAGNIGRYMANMKMGLGGNEAGFFGVTGADDTFEKFNNQIRSTIKLQTQLYGADVVSQKLQAITGMAGAMNLYTMSQEDFNKAASRGIFDKKSQENLERYNTALADLSNKLTQLKANLLSFPAEKITELLNPDSSKTPRYKNTDEWFEKRGAFGVLWDSFKMGSGMVTDYKAAGEMYGHADDVLEKAGIKQLYLGNGKKSSGGTPADQLSGYGWSPAQVAGIIKRLGLESNMNPAAVGDGGKAYGIGQWHPDRQANFEKFMGKSIRGSSIDDQLAFLNYEMTQGMERRAGDKLKQTQNADDAYRVFTNEYERPAVSVAITNNFNGAENPEEHAAVVNQGIINTTHAVTNNGSVY